jgi:hypothetical protein
MLTSNSTNLPILQNINNEVKALRIDIGLSWNAPHTKRWLGDGSSVLVLAFEPNLISIRTILGQTPQPGWGEHVLRIPSPNIKVDGNTILVSERLIIFPFALGSSHVEEAKLFVTAHDPGTSSLYRPLEFDIEAIQKTKIYRLDSILESLRIDSTYTIEILKIDTQNSDFEVLLGVGEYLKKTTIVVFERPNNKQYQNDFDYFLPADSLLRHYGFYLYKITEQDIAYINSSVDLSTAPLDAIYI